MFHERCNPYFLLLPKRNHGIDTNALEVGKEFFELIFGGDFLYFGEVGVGEACPLNVAERKASQDGTEYLKLGELAGWVFLHDTEYEELAKQEYVGS